MARWRLLGGDAAIEFELGAGHEFAFIGGQIQGCVGDIIGFAQAAERDLAGEFGLGLFLAEHGADIIEDRGIDKRWVDGVAADIEFVFGAVQGNRFGEQPDPGFGRVIGCRIVGGDEAGDG